jgi:hypothetical protein
MYNRTVELVLYMYIELYPEFTVFRQYFLPEEIEFKTPHIGEGGRKEVNMVGEWRGI